MSLESSRKKEIISGYGRGSLDTGSADVQVALLTERIKLLTSHFGTHAKDHHSRRGLLKMVGRRRRLLNYLMTHHRDRYLDLIKRLGLRR